MDNKKAPSSIPVLSWLDEPIRQSIKAVFHDLNTATEALDLFNKYRRKHFDSLKSTLGNIKILGMSQPIPLVNIYSPTFVSTTIHSRLYERDWHSAKSIAAPSSPFKLKTRSEIVRADEYIESNERVVILGGAGSGKTTFLRHLALAYSNKEVFQKTHLKTSKFPIFVSMLAYARRKNVEMSLLSYIIQELKDKTDENAEYFIKRVIEKGLAIVLLDALDEIPVDLRGEITRQIISLCSTYPKCNIVISCRTADYAGIFDNFYEVELVKLSRMAVDKIIRAWFPHDPEKAAQLIVHLNRDKDVQSLTETPLLLSLLCIQFRHDLALPKRKTELYKRCIDAFLREWDASREFRRDTAYTSLSDDRKERIFEQIAGRYFVEQIQYTFPESELIEEIGLCCERFGIAKTESRGVLGEIERHHGILERFSVDSFTFSHQSFQEHFAARYLLSKRSEFDAVKKNFNDTQWASTIEFVVSMHEDPSAILLFLKEQSKMDNLKNYPAMARRTRHLWLLYRCMNTGAALAPSTRTSLYNHLVDSQINMSNIYSNGGVFPVAILMNDGVRHTYVYFRKRPTLYDALQPLRSLANEILLSPSEEYANIVLNRLKRMSPPDEDSRSRFSYPALMLCLAIPIASIRPQEVLQWVDKIGGEKNQVYLLRMAEESKQVLERSFIGSTGR